MCSIFFGRQKDLYYELHVDRKHSSTLKTKKCNLYFYSWTNIQIMICLHFSCQYLLVSIYRAHERVQVTSALVRVRTKISTEYSLLKDNKL